MKPITCKEFADVCIQNDLIYFTGVPDSTYESWLSYLVSHPNKFQHCIAANEGAAIAHATGYHLASGKVGVAYMQNSGFGNTINPLTSLTDEHVFAIPMILMIGWRGEPGIRDEPQHKKIGKVMLSVLHSLGISYVIMGEENVKEQVTEAKQTAQKNSRPFALIIRKGLFEKESHKTARKASSSLNKQDAILEILNHVRRNDIVVATTGKIAREVYAAREVKGLSHACDFYSIGSMGHASAIALEIARQKPKTRVFIFDGDGAAIMHLGTWGTIGHYRPQNLTHIIFDNGCHESTGSQPTVSNTMDFRAIAQGCGYQKIQFCGTKSNLTNVINETKSGLSMIVVKISGSSRDDLGRPKRAPVELKESLIERLKELS